MNVRDLIKKHEGLKLVAYRCPAGSWTVGWGHNLDAHNEPVPKDGIGLEQAEVYLDADIATATLGCSQVVPNFDSLGEVRQAVMIDMCFNMGSEGLSKFKRTLGYIEQSMWNQAATAMLDSKWAAQVGRRAQTLALMMATNQWPI